jgi:hypothetical protein
MYDLPESESPFYIDQTQSMIHGNSENKSSRDVELARFERMASSSSVYPSPPSSSMIGRGKDKVDPFDELNDHNLNHNTIQRPQTRNGNGDSSDHAKYDENDDELDDFNDNYGKSSQKRHISNTSLSNIQVIPKKPYGNSYDDDDDDDDDVFNFSSLAKKKVNTNAIGKLSKVAEKNQKKSPLVGMKIINKNS